MVSTKASLARVKIKFPEQIWISEIFKKFPNIKMEIEYFLPYDLEKSIGNSIIEIQDFKIDEVIDLVRNHSSVQDFTILEQDEDKVRFNVKTRDPYLLYALIKCGVLVKFPVNVREGYAYWRLVSSRKNIDILLTIFEQKNIDFELLRIGTSPYILDEQKERLSIEESQVLDEAIKQGFFEIPRLISLEELAKNLGRSKSALSVMLRKIIKKKVVMNI
jgi:predicted DNA binding protein